MSVYDETFDLVIEKALNIAFDKNFKVYTFAFCYDHESHAVSVCLDSKVNSETNQKKTNIFNQKYFKKLVASKNLERAKNFSSANTSRSFSLGDFKLRDLGWEAIKAPKNSVPFYLAMVNAIIRKEKHIAALSTDSTELVFCCSSKDSEVGYIWTYQTN